MRLCSAEDRFSERDWSSHENTNDRYRYAFVHSAWSGTSAHTVEGLRPGYGKLAVSVLTCYEILRGLVYAGATTKLTAFETFLRANHIFTLDLPICRRAAEIHATLRQKGMLLEDADLLIASTAIANECVLVTHNVAHYERVPGIELEDWMTES